MSTPAGIHYDGDFSNPLQDGPWEPSVDEEVQTTLYKGYFQQIAVNFRRASFGITGPLGSTLVEESEFSCTGGTILRWARAYAIKPPSRTVPEPFVYPYQEALKVDGQWTLIEFPLFLTSFVTYDYFSTTTPGTISLPQTYRLSVLVNNVFGIGDPPAAGATSIIAENAKLTRWRGNIWERVTRTIPAANITNTTS